MSKKKPGGSRKPAKKPELPGRTSRKPGTRDGKPRPPENRRKTGGRTLRNGLDPAIGKKTQFQPGQCPNPGGRPKKKPVTEAYAALLSKVFPGDPQGRTYAELVAEGQFRSAIKGKTDAAKEIADRLEGKATQPMELTGEEGGSIGAIHVNFVDARERLLAKLAPPEESSEQLKEFSNRKTEISRGGVFSAVYVAATRARLAAVDVFDPGFCCCCSHRRGRAV